MYLKGIELNGFKSFADKTKLSFEPGVTSVVGPNGSGKSNISDAIRWVMGEMSAKSLRGSNMQDVIFAGTQARKPLGIAEVSIILDNSDKSLDIEYGEVTVKRRVYRSGESEYYINGASCRLKDIHELFMDTGLGREGYSIIGQGKVNEIISGKADDRRYIFDEAAGISKYRHRKNEAERKLYNTQENLTRINDIVNELSGQIEPLKKQSEKAKKYLGLREEMKKLEINVFMQSVEKLNKDIKAEREKFNIVAAQLKETEAENTVSDNEAQRLSELADEMDAQIDEKRNESTASEKLVTETLGEIDVLKKNIESNETIIARIEKDIADSENRLEELGELAKALGEEKESVLQKAEVLKKEAQMLGDKSALSGEAVSQMRLKISDLKSDIIENMNETAHLGSEQSSWEAFKKSFIERREVLEGEKASRTGEIEQIEIKLEESQKALDAAKKRASDGREKLEKLEKEADALKTDIDAKKRISDEKNAAFMREQSQINMLKEMERDYEGFAKSVKGILSAHESGGLKGVRLYGALSSLIGVEGEHSIAIEALLGASLQNVVVEDEQDAKKAIAYLKDNHMGRVTFLPVSSVKGRILENLDEIKKCEGYIGVASDLVHTNERYKEIVKNLLGRCVVADTMDHAINISKKFGYKFRVSTLGGELFNAGGSITGGSMGKSSGILSRASEIKKLEQQHTVTKRELGEILKQIQLCEKQLESANIQIKGADVVVRLAEQEAVRALSELEHIKMSALSAKQSEESDIAELEQLEMQISEANEKLASLINDMTKAELENEKINGEIAECEKQLEVLVEQQNAAQAEAGEKNIELVGAQKDIGAIDGRMADNTVQTDEIMLSVSKNREEIEQIKDKNASIREEIAQKEEQSIKTKELSDSLLIQIQTLTQKRDETRANAKKYADEGRDVLEKVYALKSEQDRIDARREKFESELDTISTKMWEEYEVTYLSAKEYEADIGSVSGAKARVSELRSSIRALGNVNVDAIEEYKAVSERHEFLSGQASDLTEAKESLEKLIDSIQEKMKSQFKEQFEIINKKFSETFSELFGGGRAELRLTDPTDILASGVEIDAQPPGKKLQNLSLLSGGEMAFTAIALLFAILKVRPTPFCVLDEIEAALDESNVYRFADYVKQYSQKTQFILVTHRRGTMEAADLLYGVTMQEKGVSKLLTLHLDEAVRIDEK